MATFFSIWDEGQDTCARNPFSKLPHQTSGRTFDYPQRLMRNKPTYTADIQRNRVSNLELSGSKAEAFSLYHLSPAPYVKRQIGKTWSAPLTTR
ncbi:hypothetical protein AVEN_136602-1 [Araneus ventricosus]|uniref:Uncharacterized protein n=1 Tax=Araneus ventricosus TaxID=182803 RepID=A0A4Y2G1T3_ARAVE|nr:hypothetical protein AVEN_136602-1 [Araneus ventricosus]